MNEDNQVKIWKYAITGALVFITLMVGSCQATNYHLRTAIENGVEPMAIQCVLGGATVERCAVLAAAEAYRE